MIIDFHTHIFSPEAIASRDKYLARDRWFSRLYSSPKARMASVEDLLAAMQADGVDTAVACGFPWTDPGLCAAENDFLIDVAAHSSGRLVAFVTVLLKAGEAAAREAARCLAEGARGIGELNAGAQGFSFEDTRLLHSLMQVADSYNSPILVHASEPVGHLYPGKGRASLQGLYHMAKAFPDNHIVLAHWGGGLLFYELMPEVQAALRNVYYDSAASPYLYRAEIFRLAPSLVGTHRLLFASDYPVLSPGRVLHQMREQGLPLGVLQAIAGDNARRLLGLPELAGREE